MTQDTFYFEWSSGPLNLFSFSLFSLIFLAAIDILIELLWFGFVCVVVTVFYQKKSRWIGGAQFGNRILVNRCNVVLILTTKLNSWPYVYIIHYGGTH